MLTRNEVLPGRDFGDYHLDLFILDQEALNERLRCKHGQSADEGQSVGGATYSDRGTARRGSGTPTRPSQSTASPPGRW